VTDHDSMDYFTDQSLVPDPAPRVNGCVSLERNLDRMTDTTPNEHKHSPAMYRSYSHETTYAPPGLTVRPHATPR
jgi:hypothetical protein